jgi:hypothetical protein
MKSKMLPHLDAGGVDKRNKRHTSGKHGAANNPSSGRVRLSESRGRRTSLHIRNKHIITKMHAVSGMAQRNLNGITPRLSEVTVAPKAEREQRRAQLPHTRSLLVAMLHLERK